MKRFIALTLILLVIGAIWAEEVSEAKEECKCAEGEENCPCLAQSQKVAKIKKAELKRALVAEKAAKKEALMLKSELKAKKSTLGKLKASIKKASEEQRKTLKVQKKAIKVSCTESQKENKGS